MSAHDFNPSPNLCSGGCGTHYCMSCGECKGPVGCTFMNVKQSYHSSPLKLPLTITYDEWIMINSWLSEFMLPQIATEDHWKVTSDEENLLNKLGISLTR